MHFNYSGWRKWALSQTSDNVRILRGLIYVSFFIFVGKVVGALKEVVLASRYGVGDVVDAYTIATMFVMLVPAIWLVVLNSVYVPTWHKMSPNQRNYLDSSLLGQTLVAGLLFMVIVSLSIPYLVPLFFDGLSSSAKNLLIWMGVGMAPSVVFSLMSIQLSAQLLANEKHVNTLAESLPGLGLILALLFWPKVPGDESLFVWGVLCGVSAQFVILAIICKRLHLVYVPKIKGSLGVWRSIRDAVGIMLVSQSLASLLDPIGLYFASTLGEGSVSIIGYSNKIIALILALGATAVGRAVLPVLSNSRMSEKEKRLSALFWCKVLFVLGACACVMGYFLAHSVVKLLFERGAFTPENTFVVAETVQFGVLQFPFYFCSVVLAQFFASCGMYLVMLKSSCIAVLAKLISCSVLVPIYGLHGLMVSTSLMFACVCIYFLFEMSVMTNVKKQQSAV